MPPELINLLIQIPLVAAFIWYSEHKDKQFFEFLREERATRETALKELGVKLEQNTDCLEKHDRVTSEAIALMKERTRPIKKVDA